MKFNDHIRDYNLGAEAFDVAAAHVRLRGLITIMMGLHYGRGFMAAARAVRHYAQWMRRASEQATRYKWKLKMLRTQAWRARVLSDLGGMKALTVWRNQPPPHKSLRVTRPALSLEDLAHRAHVKLCVQACVNPRIFRDPCKLDQEGVFRLPPKRRHIIKRLTHPNIIEANQYYEYSYDARPVYQLPHFSEPIMVWPDEFLAFAQIKAEIEAEVEAEQAEERIETQGRNLIARTLATFDPLSLSDIVPKETQEREVVFAPP